MSTSVSKRRPGWWYPFIYVGVFGVVLAVNLVFMSSAITTFTGLQTEHAYEKGLAYNQVLEQAARQKALGWNVTLEVIPHDDNSDTVHAADVVATLKDKDGKGIDGMIVGAKFVRPTSEGYDSELQLMPQGEGRYVGVVKLALPGQWDVHMRAHKDKTLYTLSQRVLVP